MGGMNSQHFGFFLNDPSEKFLPADELTWNCGIDGEDPFGVDRHMRHEVFARYTEHIADWLAKEYIKIYEKEGRHAAAWYLVRIQSFLQDRRLNAITDIDEIVQLAKLKAYQFLVLTQGHTPSQALLTYSTWVTAQGVEIPTDKGNDGAFARLKHPDWWRRNLHTAYSQDWEEVAIRLGMVSRYAGLYVSDEAVRLRQSQKARNRDLLSVLKAVNEEGDEYSLLELAEKSVSNPTNRRAELMARLAGFEHIALTRGDVAHFMTITCPGRMHAVLSKSGDRNPRYDGTTPKQAQAYLNKIWAKIRAKLKRQDIRPYGFRIAEPQHDGTPHWHLLLFVAPENCERMVEIIRDYALREDGDEPGAAKHRFTDIVIDYEKGTATGYVAKYISKNIDGFGLEQGLNGEQPAEGALRTETWASLWKIRQFQQIGGPPVTVYRQLRRLSTKITGDERLEAARAAADTGDWAGFVMAMGGPAQARKNSAITLAKVWNDEPGKYGEPKGYEIIGVSHGILTIVTRNHQWTIEFSPLSTGQADVLSEASSAQPGLGPAGDAAASARLSGVPVSRDENSKLNLRV